MPTALQLSSLGILFGALAICLSPQATIADDSPFGADLLSARIEEGRITVPLKPSGPNDLVRSLGWSMPGTRFPLEEAEADSGAQRVLTGLLEVGDLAKVRLRLTIEQPSELNEGAKADLRSAVLEADIDGNGTFEESEASTIKPRLSRQKIWYSGRLELQLPTAEQDDSSTTSKPRNYPVSVWYVFDPAEKEMEVLMRWSPRGWHQGEFSIAGQPCMMVVSERVKDGIFTKDDAWGLATGDRFQFRSRNSGFRIDSHAWLGDIGYRIVSIDQNGSKAVIEAVDVGMTREEEDKKNDPYAADRAFARTKRPVIFFHNFERATARAKAKNQLIFVDFETTWCGPCKTMDQLVYSAEPVAEKCRDFVCVKLDGDEQRDLVKQYKIEAYPTMLLVDADGEEIARCRGYQSVAELLEFLKQAK